jgi:hypothetical protein
MGRLSLRIFHTVRGFHLPHVTFWKKLTPGSAPEDPELGWCDLQFAIYANQ